MSLLLPSSHVSPLSRRPLPHPAGMIVVEVVVVLVVVLVVVDEVVGIDTVVEVVEVDAVVESVVEVELDVDVVVGDVVLLGCVVDVEVVLLVDDVEVEVLVVLLVDVVDVEVLVLLDVVVVGSVVVGSVVVGADPAHSREAPRPTVTMRAHPPPATRLLRPIRRCAAGARMKASTTPSDPMRTRVPAMTSSGGAVSADTTSRDPFPIRTSPATAIVLGPPDATDTSALRPVRISQNV